MQNIARRLGILAGAILLLSACGGGTSAPSSSANAAQAKSAADVGGMAALVAAAKAEGQLNVIALPPDWANYGAIINAFTTKYGIPINSANPNGGSQDEVNAIKTLGNRGPDVVDVGMAVATKNTDLFAPYQVSTWSDIPVSQKEATGLWFQDYGGYMSIGYDSAKVPAITSIQDLLGSAFKGKVALAGDALLSNQAMQSIMMVSIANGGSPDDISKGVDFFHTLKHNGNWIAHKGTDATVKEGDTPVLFEWDYLSGNHKKDVPTWKIYTPNGAVVGSYYAQAISKTAPHPAAARLWEEYLYSNEGQNFFLKGLARPVRMAAMTKAGTVDTTAAAAVPAVNGTPVFLTEGQATAATAYLTAHWAAAIG